MNEFHPEGWRIDTLENRNALATPATLADACHEGSILEARALVCDAEHNLIVDLGCMQGVIPREEGALGIREGTVRDIAVISRVNRPVCFLVTGFQKNADGKQVAVLSRRAAQELCMQYFISTLRPGDIINARVTHLESFGAFADIGCGIVSLLPIDTISVSRIDHPRERFSVGMNASLFSIGETVAGIVRSVEEYGAFVELTPNLAGLAETKEGVRAGQQASVHIKNIIPSRMKVKLIIIDHFDYDYRPSLPHYFITGKHIDYFRYSPESADKLIETVF